MFDARLIDRLGKGLRGAPRDALIADVAPAGIRGACFGLRQAMDTVGAVLGPLAAIALMAACSNRIAIVLWFAVLPAWVAVLLIVLGVSDEGLARRALPERGRLKLDFPAPYSWIVAVGVVFTLARFSEAFLILRACDLGLGLAWAPLVMVVMSLIYTVSAYPAGWLSDRMPRGAMLALGLVALIAADFALAFPAGKTGLMVGVALWGLHMGLSQGVLAALVADVTPAEQRGTAFGLFNFACGVALLPASAVAGWLWQGWGAVATFMAGAGFAAVALLLAAIALWRRRSARRA